MTKDFKEKIQYSISIVLILAGVVMGFMSFFLNHYDIEAGTLVYIAQCFIAGGSFMGVAVYLDKHLQDLTDALRGTNPNEKKNEKD